MSEKLSEKKIAYALICYDALHSGVYRKVLDQVAYWRLSGYNTQIFVITDPESRELWKKLDNSAVILLDSSPLSKLINRFKLLGMAVKTGPSLIYLRDSFPIRIPRSSTPITLEVQSLVGRELKIRSYKKYLFFCLFKKSLYSRIGSVIYVTNELSILNEARVKEHAPKITIGNGINLNRIDILQQKKDKKLGLFFVGSPNQPWHGLSELINFARLNHEVDVHIVGDVWDHSPPNVFFYGRLMPNEYREIASKCVAGIGTLNLSAKQMTEASPLKVREYLAMGLPVITRYRDVDLDPLSDFVLQLPADERAFSDFSVEILSFLESWKSKRVDRSAVAHLDVTIKESLRLGFFEQILNIHKAKVHSKGQK